MENEQKGMSKMVYWLLGLLIVGLLFGGAAYLYVNSNSGTSETASTTTKPVQTKATSTEVSAANTDTQTLISDLDKELASIDNDLNSTEDNTSDL